MAHLCMERFGPIAEVRLEQSDFLLLNGAQGSGKSTLAKALYFFASLPELIFEALIADGEPTLEFDKKLVAVCRRQLMAFFGTTKHLPDFLLAFDYTPEVSIRITRDAKSGHARVKLSAPLRDALLRFAREIGQLGGAPGDLALYRAERLRGLNVLKRNLQALFAQPRVPLFIPAGRSLAATLSGELSNIDSYQFDALTKAFVERLLFRRQAFAQGLDEMIEDRKRLSAERIDFGRTHLARDLINGILGGRYRMEQGEERLELEGQAGYVKLKFASSGQQEALWILLFLFDAILGGTPTACVIEEPEAHLYPSAQYAMTKLIALFAADARNQTLMTTHSPYVVAAVNNLLLAGMADKSESSSPISSELALDGQRVAAYFLEDGRLVDMIDADTGLIDPGFVDRASEAINQDFDQLCAGVVR